MATIDTLQDAVNTLTSSTTTLLNEVSVNKSTLTESKDLAETAATSATTQAANAASSASAASSSASSASASASAASASAASASAIVTGVATGMPSVRPSLNLDFVNSKTVDPRISFTRSTTATYYDGKTTAKAEENLLLWSQFINGAGTPWNVAYGSASTNSAVAPDGTTTATKLIPNSAIANHQYWQNRSGLAVDYSTISIYAKASGYNYMTMALGGAVASASFDLVNGTVTDTQGGGSTASMQDVGNGWYRCILVTTSTAGASNFSVWPHDAAIRAPFSGDGTSGIYVWGAQVELRDSVTAYTPTTSSPITNYIPVLQTAAINEPRLDHDPVTGEAKGLLIEESRTNLTFNSTTASDATLYNGGLKLNNSVVAPDGTLTATEIFNNSGTGNVLRINTGALDIATTYTASVWMKVISGDATGIRLEIGDSALAYPTLTDQWVRYSTTGSPAATGFNFIDIDNIPDGCRIAVWGAQIEAGSFPTSYIPTSGASVTRAADRTKINGDAFASFFNDAEGTFYTKATAMNNVGGFVPVYVHAGNDSNRIFIYNGTYQGYVTTNGAVTAQTDFGDARVGEWPLAFGYANNDFISVSGSSIGTDTSGNVPVGLHTMGLAYSASGYTYTGWIKNVAYYPQRIPTSEMSALTQS